MVLERGRLARMLLNENPVRARRPRSKDLFPVSESVGIERIAPRVYH